MDNSARSMAATYYQSGAQEGLQTLYLMNQGYPLYADAPHAADMGLLSSPAVEAPVNPRVPLQPTGSDHEISDPLQAFPSASHHTLWGSGVAPRLGLRQPQGLSLSLSPQQTTYMPASTAGFPNGESALQSLWVGSKYLKAAQELLEEVASIVGENRDMSITVSGKKNWEDTRGVKQAAGLTASERQELQMKKAKLVHMFEEVEKRYMLYHNQMQTVVTSFEAAAGIGAARVYTALALQTISKQFRCLRDAIIDQIRAASRSLGEEPDLVGDNSPGSRLRRIDQQVRQQRALQRIAIMQHNAWRPQRGLPERSVSILRAWLFEHFLHPYPKDSDKQMLAKQTGLTRSQVSNWFINARVRLWKPMVEEMYIEEVKAGAKQSSGEEQSSKSSANDETTSKSIRATEQTNLQLPPIASCNPSKMLNGDHAFQQSMEIADCRLTNGDARVGAYAMGQLERLEAEQFGARMLGKGVSLSLGLPHSESLSLSGGQPTFFSADGVSLGRIAEMGNSSNDYRGVDNEASVVRASNAFEDIDVQSRRRFSAQLLRDFVA